MIHHKSVLPIGNMFCDITLIDKTVTIVCIQHFLNHVFIIIDSIIACFPDPFYSTANPGHSKHTGTETAANGSGHLHENSRLLLYCYLLWSPVQRGTVHAPSSRLIYLIAFVSILILECRVVIVQTKG